MKKDQSSRCPKHLINITNLSGFRTVILWNSGLHGATNRRKGTHRFIGDLFSQDVGEEEGSEDEDVGSGGDAGQPERVDHVGNGGSPPSSSGQDNDNDH